MLAKDPQSDAFALLGLSPVYAIDRDALEDAYLKLAAAAHPDRHAGADSGTRRLAMELSAAINAGYRTLRDPVSRAEYLVKLAGIDLDSSDAVGGAPKMDQAFLIEMIERREAVAEAKSKGPSGLAALREQIEGELDDTLDEAIDALGEPAVAARRLVARRYLQRLIDEVDAALEGEGS